MDVCCYIPVRQGFMAYALTVSPYHGRFTTDIFAGFRICRLSGRMLSYVFRHASSSAIIRNTDTRPLRNSPGTLPFAQSSSTVQNIVRNSNQKRIRGYTPGCVSRIYMSIRETLITYISRYLNLSTHGLPCDILISGILFEI